MNSQSSDSNEKAFLAAETRATVWLLMAIIVPIAMFVLLTTLVQFEPAFTNDLYVIAMVVLCAGVFFASLFRTVPMLTNAMNATELFYAEKRHIHSPECTKSGAVEIIETRSYSSGVMWGGLGYVRLIRQRARCTECGTVTVYEPPADARLEVVQNSG